MRNWFSMSHCPFICRVFLAGMSLYVLTRGAAADDWPTFRHDIARSAITSESLPPGLTEQWVFVPAHGPEVAWPDPKKEKPREQFDEAFHVAVAGDIVYFGSSADNKVYALDAATGAVRWTAFTGGPVRCAPTVCNGKVYVGSDDGYAYCLRADDGALVWQVRAGFADKKLIGNGKMISLWPVRTGVVVDNGTAYFGAGVFPHAATFVYAVNAEDGSLIWRNDTCGEQGASMEFGGMTLEGYILASDNTVYVPSGRAMPAAFGRENGQFLYYCSPGGKVGGTWALVADDGVVAGMEGKRAYDEKTGAQTDAEYAWFPGYQLIVTKDYSYVLDYEQLRVLDRKAHQFAGGWRTSILNARKLLTDEVNKLERDRTVIAEGERAARDARIGDLNREIERLNAQLKAVEEGVHKWRKPTPNHEAMILAGETLVLGGDGEVAMVNALRGDDLWSAKAPGRAVGLAVANGRLFVSSTTGAIHCFAQGGGTSNEIRVPVTGAPYPEDGLTAMYASAADAVVAQTKANAGFCLVYGSEKGRLAYELAKRTQMKIIGIDPNPDNVAVARQALDAAGMLGRVVFDQGDLDTLPYADYFANLIVSDTMMLTGKPAGSPQEIHRVLKPCGGVVCLGQPAGGAGMDTGAVATWLAQPVDAPKSKQGDAEGVWLLAERGPLPGAGSWTHLYADPANTACSDDQLVKGPLGMLWFGEPGSQYMVERHARPPAPVAMDGRLIVQGENEVMAYDAYNGTLLWRRDLPGAVRTRVDSDMGNLALTHDALYVATRDTCVRLDPATGETVRTYALSPRNDKAARRWGYLACADGLLFGTSAQPLQGEYGAFWKDHAGADGQWKDLDRVAKGFEERVKEFVEQFPKADVRGYWAVQQSGLMWRDMADWPAWGSVQKPEGAVTSRIMAGDALFAMDPETGATRWTYKGRAIAHPAIAIADGAVFLADCDVSDAEKGTAIEEKKALLAKGVWEDGGEMQFEPQDADVRRVVALDAATGKKRWERVIDLTGCGGDRMGLAYQDGVLLAFGCFSNHDREMFRQGLLAWRRITALNGANGGDVWSKPLNYLRRPVVVGNEILIEPRICEVRTGNIKTRVHPLTGAEETWEYIRPGHCCSATSAAPHMFFLRGHFLWYYDLIKDQGMMPFGGIRPGCWINTIPANGLVLFPEAAAGCTCSYPIRATVALKPQEHETNWGILVQRGAMTPVNHMAVNLGAPGDWRDADGTLWFGYPHFKGNSFYQYATNFHLNETFLDNMGYVSRNFEGIDVKNTDKPWLFASAAVGMTGCQLPLLDEGQGTGTYTVRLYFADPESQAPDQRVFTVKLQGKTVLKDFDIVKEAGGPHIAVVKEFSGVKVEKGLDIALLPRTENPSSKQAPLLNGVEVIREALVVARAE